MTGQQRTAAQLDALRLTEAVRKRMVDFACDNSFVHDKHLAAICQELWGKKPEEGGLLSDLWVEGAFPAKTAPVSLGDLAQKDLFDPNLCDQLDRRAAVPRSRHLYTHQAEALEKARDVGAKGERPSLVVTAGTGAGKTESFLLPILNDLYSHPANAAAGMKCLILYPMNALVNDQVDRLHDWLKGQDRVTLFHFTSETPEDKRRADDAGVPMWDASRIRTRQEARGLETKEGKRLLPDQRGRMPDIVITNYSMLEYMLCRPQDAVFFGPALRAIVLDEAHLYTGTLAAEITLLLRRLMIRCGVSAANVLQIATSATLGTGSADELRNFAAKIFTKEAESVHIIVGESVRVLLHDPAPPAGMPTASDIAQGPWLDAPLMEMTPESEPSLARNADLCSRLRERLPLLVSERTLREIDPLEDRPAVLLRKALSATPIIHQLESLLWQKQRLPLSALADTLWGACSQEAERATATLLQLSASARAESTDYPLVPHRIHLMVRPSAGLSICLNSDCAGDMTRKLSPLGIVSARSEDHCSACGHAVLSLYRCRNCGEWLLAGITDGFCLRPAPGAWPKPPHAKVILYTMESRSSGDIVIVNPKTGECSGAGATGVRIVQVAGCPHCGGEEDDIVPFSSGAPLALAILAETILAELPEYPSSGNHRLPARGRRLLAFSDSRQEAARLGPRLTHQHETQLIRAAIVDRIEAAAAADATTIVDIEEDIKRLELEIKNPNLTEAQRQRKESKLTEARHELQSSRAGGPMSQWATSLAKQPLLAEILDVETGGAHYAHHESHTWSQDDWEKNYARAKQRALTFLAREFASPIWRAISVETAGLGEVTYPGLDALSAPMSVIGELPQEQARQKLQACWSGFLHAICDTLRTDGAITLGDETTDNSYQFGSVLLGRWCAQDKERGHKVIRFVGTTDRQRRRQFAAAVLRSCGLDEKDAIKLAPDMLVATFEQLLGHATEGPNVDGTTFRWLQRSTQLTNQGPTAEALRLVFPELGLRRPFEYYRCTKTGHIWYRSVQGCAPEQGCNDTIVPVTSEDLNEDPRLSRQRGEYRESPIFQMGLWAEEHSAQLAPEENRRLQDLFKVGIRNVLSATTTLELGIDIGGLNAVLMSNVPPGKANYLQRAGRAGRRADGSAIVVTFARPRPFDEEVFNHIGDYLDRALRRPLVFLDRERVVRRHLHAFLLGEFFKAIYPPDRHVGAMNAFGSMGAFNGVLVPPYWKDGSKPSAQMPTFSLPSDTVQSLLWWNPARKESGLEGQFMEFLCWQRDWGETDLRDKTESLMQGTIITAQIDDWGALFDAVAQHCSDSIKEWRGDYDNLWRSWHETDDRRYANSIRYQISALCDLTVIEALADRQFLPHYGFPIGVQKLRVIVPDQERKKIRDEDQYRLERSSLLALGEYVPGSQLLVGGQLVSSRGLLKHWTGANLDMYIGLRGACCTCDNKHFYYWVSGDDPDCPICGAPARQSPQQLLFPKYGFSSAAWDPPKWSTDVDRVGEAITATMTFTEHPTADGPDTLAYDFGGVSGLLARYREDGELLVYNSGDYDKGFAICLNCGYADSEKVFDKGKMRLPGQFATHAGLTSAKDYSRCWKGNDAPVLRNQVLAAREITDVLLMDFYDCLGTCDVALASTLGFALQRAGAQLLQLDTRELGVLPIPTGSKGSGWGVVLYDNTPGGAGHVRELLNQKRNWLIEARSVLFVNERHDAHCETACLHCLLSFDAQNAMSRGLLKRRLALQALDGLLDGGLDGRQGGASPANSPPPSPSATGPSQDAPPSVPVTQRSLEERLRIAQQRLQERRR